MTKSRTDDRLIFGLLGAMPKVQAAWEKRFRDMGVNACMSKYPTEVATLPERLSEMFHFDRRGYIVAPSLQRGIVPLLDVLHASSRENGLVDTVVNRNGVLYGYFFGNDDEARAALWFSSTKNPLG